MGYMSWDHMDAFIVGTRAVGVGMVTGTGTDVEKLNYLGSDIYEFRNDKILHKDTYGVRTYDSPIPVGPAAARWPLQRATQPIRSAWTMIVS